jgi:hypothetical protein
MLNYFCQLLIVHGVNDVRQTEVHAAEPLVPEPSFLRLRLFLKSLSTWRFISFKVLSELIQASGNTLHSEITNVLILF